MSKVPSDWTLNLVVLVTSITRSSSVKVTDLTFNLAHCWMMVVLMTSITHLSLVNMVKVMALDYDPVHY